MVSLGQLCRIQLDDGASTIYRENASRCVAIKESVRGRDLGSTVREAIEAVGRRVRYKRGTGWTGLESTSVSNEPIAA